MNPSDQSHDDPPQDHQIGDQNVERLLASVYHPEPLDPEFVSRVRQRAETEAVRQQGVTRATPPENINTFSRSTIWWLVGTTALVLLVVAGYFATRNAFQRHSYYVDGDLVWIDGQAFQPTHQTTLRDAPGSRVGPRRPSERPAVPQRTTSLRIGHAGLTPRSRPTVIQRPVVSVGEIIVTERGQRRRVELPDGSILYVNEQATVRIRGNRRIVVDSGEVFVEVSPAEEHDGARFVVQTPRHDVTAVGTKFAVDVAKSGTGVAVAQGKVNISGIEPALLAGQQLRWQNDGDNAERPVTPLPRTSHVLHWTRDLMAAAETPLVPDSKHRGGALVAVDPQGQQAKLSLRKYHVDVHIEDGFARTTIDQTYFNHLTSRLEGTFYFPLPPDASISRLAMYVNGKLMEGGMAERDHARNVFETIKHRALDPALLEWVDGSTFKMRVFPLEGRQEKRIVLSYTQRLGSNYGRTEYRFPVGHDMDSVRDWSVRLHVVDGERLRWKCSSHDLQADTKLGNLTLTSAEADAKPDRDVVFTLLDDANDSNQNDQLAKFSSVVHDGYRYMMLRYRPKLQTVERRPRRDWIFLFDADGSRDPMLARVQIDIIKTLLENAEHDDTFSVITAGTRVHTVTEQPWPVTDENIMAAVKLLEQTQLIGALDINLALEACRDVARTVGEPTLVHVGSAIPILGQRASDRLLEQLPSETPYVGVGVGRRWNRQFMKAAASKSGGYFTQINPDEPTGWRAFELLATLNSPRLLDLHVEADSEQTEFFNFSDSAAHGEEICAIVRQEPGQPKINAVTVTGSLDGAPFRQTVSVEHVEEDAAYLPRIWAKLAIDDMVTRGAEANKVRIIELSKSMYVMSPFTSLLVLENDEMYQQYNVDRGRKDHWALYPCPAEIDVVHEPILGPSPPDTPVVPIQESPKPSREDVLKTLLVRASGSGYSALTRRQLAREYLRGQEGKTALTGRIRRLLGHRRHNITFGKGIEVNSFGDTPFGAGSDNLIFQRFDGETTPFTMMVTPRIIIQEEEEELLGIELNNNGSRLEEYADFDQLIDLITRTITPETWDDVGGLGTVEAFPTNLSLVISQSQTVDGWGESFEPVFLGTRIYPVGDLVIPVISGGESYRAMQSVESSGIPFSGEPAIDYPDAQTWAALGRHRRKYTSVDFGQFAGTEEGRILAELDKQTNFDFVERPLQEVIDEIALRYKIPIIIDTTSLDDYGISTDTPVTIHLKGVSLRSALQLMLRELDLTYFIQGKGLQITTPEELHHLLSRSAWYNETLLMIPRRGSSFGAASSAANDQETSLPMPHLDDPRIVDHLAKGLSERLDSGTEQRSLLYPALIGPGRGHNSRHLVSLARGITTTRADALAVLDKEADLGQRPRMGRVDKKARAMIDAARRQGWQRVARRDDTGRDLWQMTVDGQGRFRYEHKTKYGLTETIVCNGKSLWHLYHELGLGTTRTQSRFHRAELARLVPWLVAPVEDLAIGADVRLVGPRTIAIAPHGFDDARDEQSEPRLYRRLHLLFSPDGRLSARHLVEMPAGKTVMRVTFDADGTTRWFNADDTPDHEIKLSVESTTAPNLQPDVADLVMLPMPIRTRDHVYKTAKNRAASRQASPDEDALQSIVADRNRSQQQDPVNWNEEDALRLLVSLQWQNSQEMRNVIGRRFFAKGDRRIGFYTLLMATGQTWNADKPVQLDDGTATRMSPMADHPDSLLARYLESHLRATPLAPQVDRPIDVESQDGFIAQFTEFQRLCLLWHPFRLLPEDAETRQQQLEHVFDFIDRCDSPRFAFVLLRRVQRQFGKDQPHHRIAEALIKLESQGMTSFVIKYELARSLAAHGQRQQAQQLFMELYRGSLEAGIVPPLDQSFRAALKKRDKRFWANEDTGKDFGGFMRGACSHLIRRDQRGAAIALAWQCRQLGDAKLAGKLIDLALTGIPAHLRLETTLIALDYLVQVGDHQRAVSLLQPLLTTQPYSQSPELWRLAARIAQSSGMLVRSINSLERAADLEYANLSKSYNVEQVRKTYSQLVARYQEMAKIVAADSQDASPLDLATRAVQAADRWRSLDTDATAACQQAANLLNTLGQDELAWDYLTTPLVTKPNESTAWLSLAQTLRDQDSVDLADRAYDAAWEAESTNARILWDHAQMLEHAGRIEDARRLYQQIVDSQWQPRFRPIQGRAKRIIAAAEN